MGDDTYRHPAFLRPCQAVAFGLPLSFRYAVSALYAAERKIERQAVMRAAFFHQDRLTFDAKLNEERHARKEDHDGETNGKIICAESHALDRR